MNTRFVPRIEKPCPMDWNAMEGDEKRRFCEHCQLHVNNLSAMTTQEQVELMKSPGERKCVTYTAPSNARPVDAGTWLTFQSATGWRKAVAAMLAAAFSMFATSCRTTGTPIPSSEPKTKLGKMEVKAEKPTEPEKPLIFGDPKNPIAGGIMCPPTPWWKKILFLE
jgi:hypothetical protein